MNAQVQEVRFEEDEILATRRARKHYVELLAVARAAAGELRSELARGLPVLAPLPGGGFEGTVMNKHAAISRLANAFAWANVRLHLAAQAVCDVANLPNDGHDEDPPIEWEVKL